MCGDLWGTHGTRGAFLGYSSYLRCVLPGPTLSSGQTPVTDSPPQTGLLGEGLAPSTAPCCLGDNGQGTPAGWEPRAEDSEDNVSNPSQHGLRVVPAALPRVPLSACSLCSQQGGSSSADRREGAAETPKRPSVQSE